MEMKWHFPWKLTLLLVFLGQSHWDFHCKNIPVMRQPLQRQGGRRGDQQMTLSVCDKLAEILPAASCRPPAAFEALTGLRHCHHHSECQPAQQSGRRNALKKSKGVTERDISKQNNSDIAGPQVFLIPGQG